jgi:hypothetical protein
MTVLSAPGRRMIGDIAMLVCLALFIWLFSV